MTTKRFFLKTQIVADLQEISQYLAYGKYPKKFQRGKNIYKKQGCDFLLESLVIQLQLSEKNSYELNILYTVSMSIK